MIHPAAEAAKLTSMQQTSVDDAARRLAKALTETREEMATSRSDAYLADRSSGGIYVPRTGLQNIYYDLLCILSIDSSKKVPTLLKTASPQIQTDIQLLEQIRLAKNQERSELILQALKSKLPKETLKKLFDPAMLSLIFEKNSPGSDIVDLIEKAEAKPDKKVEKVAADAMPLPPPKAPVVKNPTDDDEALARRLQEEEREIQQDLIRPASVEEDAALAAHLQEQEEALHQALCQNEEQQQERVSGQVPSIFGFNYHF